ncbi:MAG: DUF423 domain-containing protein [Saprospiraceae bacterium]|nr:DUF423 domain-containing protein [Candidatus Opimibacter iunctus]
MNNTFFNRIQTLAAGIGAIGVIFGAFGAHFLKSKLPVGDLETIKTGVLYLFIHTLATLLVCALSQHSPNRVLKASSLAFIIGTVMFSGSLFVIGTASLTGFPVSMIGFITPLGGLAFILGWILLIFSPKNK